MLISRNKQAYLNQKEKRFAFEEYIFIVETVYKGGGGVCSIQGNNAFGLKILSILVNKDTSSVKTCKFHCDI